MSEGEKSKSAKVIGTMTCLLCPHEVPVKEQKSTGYAQYSCQWCGYQSYCRSEDSDARMRAKVTPTVERQYPAPAAKEEPAPAAEQKPVKRKSPLSF